MTVTDRPKTNGAAVTAAKPPRVAGEFALTENEAARFHAEGYLGPFAICAPEQMNEWRKQIDSDVLPTTGPNPKSPLQCRHLDKRLVHDIVTRPQILDRLASLMGDDLILWATYFFNKEPGGKEIPWHQDFNYWPIEPLVNLSAWIAIDPVTTENSCVRIIPGSHKKIVPHIPSRDGMAFGEEADPAHVDDAKAVNMELKPGEFFLFNERLLHQSNKNVSQMRRLGLTCRVTVPFVRVDHDRGPLFPGHRNVVVRGRDTMGFNRLASPPEH